MEDILKALEAARAGLETARRLYAQFEGIKDALSSDDKAAIEAKLSEVQAEYDQTHNAAQKALRG